MPSNTIDSFVCFWTLCKGNLMGFMHIIKHLVIIILANTNLEIEEYSR